MLSSMTLLDTETVLFENEQFFPVLLFAVNPPTISDYFGKFILRIGQAKTFFKNYRGIVLHHHHSISVEKITRTNICS